MRVVALRAECGGLSGSCGSRALSRGFGRDDNVGEGRREIRRRGEVYVGRYAFEPGEWVYVGVDVTYLPLAKDLRISRPGFMSVRVRLEERVPRSTLRARVWEFLLFGFKQAWACLFGGVLLALVLLTKFFWPAHAPLARYDFLFLAALCVQALLLLFRMETLREAKVILVFHVVGTAMELFKTSVGSWTYPEHCFFHIGHVPLFSGFMYASVGSFLARVTRIFDMRYTGYPKKSWTVALAVLIYANFFANHFVRDVRVLLFVMVAAAFGRTWVYYKPYRVYRRMPLLLGFVLVALFIWAAENIGTFAAVWVYPHQQTAWQMVHFSKLGSWLLLMIISFILVSLVHPPRVPPRAETEEASGGAEASGLLVAD